MSFIDKDQRIMSWQTKIKPNITSSKHKSPVLSCLPFFHFDLNCFVQRQTSLTLTSRPYICRLFLFFLPPRLVYISVSPNWSELDFVLSSMWSLGQDVCCFSPAIVHLLSFWCLGNLQNHPVSLKIYASLFSANSKSLLNIKSIRQPT